MKMITETIDQPKMLEVYVSQAWHQLFCYGLAYEEGKNKNNNTLLLAVISGSDSAVQSARAVCDIGVRGGVRFGYGTKGERDYEFTRELILDTEKGSYQKFPMTLTNSRKGLVIAHEDLRSRYILSFDKNPAHDVAQVLGGAPYGLYIDKECEDIVFVELVKQGLITKVDCYVDESLFDGFHLYENLMSEEDADNFISRLIREQKVRFNANGMGKAIEKMENLTDYLQEFNQPLIEKVSLEAKPDYDARVEKPFKRFEQYPQALFPVQAHNSTALAKRFKKQKSQIIQGEMSVGKSKIMTAIADAMFNGELEFGSKNERGFHALLLCPPSLTDKWPKEIRSLLPHAEVHVITNTSELIFYHREWERQGKPKPTKPTFFIFAFTTMREGTARIEKAVSFTHKATEKQNKDKEIAPYRYGYYCPCCGEPHQTVEDSKTHIDEEGNEYTEDITHTMSPSEFGTSRRLKKSQLPANAFCYNCGESLWKFGVSTRYQSFREWTQHEQKVMEAIGEPQKLKLVQASQPTIKKVRGKGRTIASVEYIRRQMRGFFDIGIYDEVHELKGGNTAQGNALGALAAVCKKNLAGTGTLFGGKASDIYYLLFRLFPSDMTKAGYKYEEYTRFAEEFGNVEETSYAPKAGKGEFTNTNSRGGMFRSKKKIVPGISPYIYSKFMIQNIVNVRLKDVWPDPVPLVDTPTIMVPMSDELKSNYRAMISHFERLIDTRDDGFKFYRMMMDYGIAYPDNPFTMPDALFKVSEFERECVWEATHLSPDCTLPKEEKLQEIIQSELSERRASIVYVRDTGTSNPQRDVRPRLKQKLEEIGAKVCILDVNTVDTNKRSQWLEQKINKEGYNVCLVSQELVKTGLDLLCTPTIIFYQFSWSLFTINQAAKRSHRIGQTEECRLFYLAYEDTFQEQMATIIAKKNRATAAINGDSAGGLSAMLGDEGDLREMLLKSIQQGEKVLSGSAEEWIAQTSDRARELLANIGKKKAPLSTNELFDKWVNVEIENEAIRNQLHACSDDIVKQLDSNGYPGFRLTHSDLVVDYEEAFGFIRQFVTELAIADLLLKDFAIEPTLPVIDTHVNAAHVGKQSVSQPVEQLTLITIAELSANRSSKKKPKQTKTSENQLVFDLFG